MVSIIIPFIFPSSHHHPKGPTTGIQRLTKAFSRPVNLAKTGNTPIAWVSIVATSLPSIYAHSVKRRRPMRGCAELVVLLVVVVGEEEVEVEEGRLRESRLRRRVRLWLINRVGIVERIELGYRDGWGEECGWICIRTVGV